MKKFIIFTLAAIVAAVTLSSATINLTGSTSNGSVRFESSSVPALNFTMPVSRAADIYRLMPDSITALCGSEYEAVRAKSFKSTSFTHQGVTVKRTGENPSCRPLLELKRFGLAVLGLARSAHQELVVVFRLLQ